MTSEKKRQKLAGVVGWPATYSLSPIIHHYWANREGISVDYQIVPSSPSYETFVKTIDDLRVSGFGGVNVTIPHKENALQYADIVTDIAKNAGAANMLTFTNDGVIADNSDAGGFAAALSDVAGENLQDKSILILGSGGAAKGIIAGLFGKCGSIRISNRTEQKAVRLAEQWDAMVVPWAEKEKFISQADILINSTSLGMRDELPLEISPELLNSKMVICDIVYVPLETPLLKAAKIKNCRIVDGLAMLMHQAVPGYKTWLGKNAIVDNGLRDLLVKTLKERTMV